MNISLSIRHFMAETYGTFVVVFLGTLSYVLFVSTNPNVAMIVSAITYGGSYTAMHYTLSHISGAHLNPIVSIALTFGDRLTIRQLVNYIVAQLLGAIAAATMIFLITNSLPLLSYDILGYGPLSPFQTTPAIAFVVEMFTGFFIVYVYVAVSQRRLAAWTGVSVGLMMTMVVLATGLLTGGHANPARSVATLWLMEMDGQQQLLVFVLAPIVGGLLAQLFYKHLKYEDRHDVA